ncbi:MAG: hypothetical protein Q9M31_02010 [Mariprofundus sp.]|nr:hypothetical protein [Mariprofundus sp.]
MYSCKQASRMASDALDRKLTWSEFFHLKLHLMMCGMCRGFNQNIHLLESALKNINHKSSREGLSADEKESIKKSVKRALENEHH